MSSKKVIKFQRGDVLSDKCPSREVLKHVTSKWGGMILLCLANGEVKRFSELKRQIVGISEKMLTQNLKKLEEYGLVVRVAYDVIPPYVEYSLSNVGLELAEYYFNLADWIEVNLNKILKND